MRALINTAFAARLPEGADPLEIAPILCAGVTVVKGLKVTDTRRSWAPKSRADGCTRDAVTTHCDRRSRRGHIGDLLGVEQRSKRVGELGLREDDDVVAGLQSGVGADGDQLAGADDDADPDVAGVLADVIDGGSVG